MEGLENRALWKEQFDDLYLYIWTKVLRSRCLPPTEEVIVPSFR